MVSAETSGAGAAGPLILLCGPSGVGKSSVAKELAAARHLALLSQDSYFGGDFVPYAEALERGRAEMEDPDHIDWVALRGAARAARQNGRACLLEGHTLLSDAALVDEASCILFLDASPEACTERRIGRRERSEQERAEISAYYLRFVWPAHLRHVRPVMERLRDAGRATVLDATAPHEQVVIAALAALDVALAALDAAGGASAGGTAV